MKPKLLDLFCGAGGASMGYHLAGFDVLGVDIEPQARYPFEFVQADAMTFPLEGYDVIHASPPCQRYSRAERIHGNGGTKPDLVEAVRERLRGTRYVIENVQGAPLRDPLMLCGGMFGLRVRRHRLFEMPIFMLQPSHPPHRGTTNSSRAYSSFANGATHISCVGHNFRRDDGARAMGIDWMTRGELSQAIPPAYTEYIGRQLIKTILSNTGHGEPGQGPRQG